ncbi:MAG: GTPase Era [Clostridiales bacterium]|nr:GTPase Era [Clostridiales bacterium]
MKCGTVAVVGKANAGKSTLINVIVGEKVAIVSPKPQTTRDRILGVLTTSDYQIIFEDTPGFYRSKTELNRKMQKTARKTVKDVDLVLFVLDGHDGLKEEDLTLLKSMVSDIPLIVAMSKTDIMPKENIPENLVKIAEIDGISEIIPVSARKNRNVKELIDTILKYLPTQDRIFSEDVVSDKSSKFMVSEIMREKILLKLDKEIPHGVAVLVNEFRKNKNGVYEISLDIVCEKQNHKAILIGKQGAKIKEISAYARQDMEKFLDAKVFLTTYVKVKENWRDKEALISEFGYIEQ